MSRLDVRENVRQRFEFIEFQLKWEGGVGRKKLQDKFLISPQQATKDLTAYADTCPNNMVYDPRRKTYIPTERFESCFAEGTAAEYLHHLDMISRRHVSVDETWINDVPTFEAVNIPSREIRTDTLETILTAIRNKAGVRGRYVSMASDNTEFRTLFPHALGCDGHRWHVRAFDFGNARYSDFVLSRLMEVELTKVLDRELPEDTSWNTHITVILRPDPSLPAAKAQQLQLEYNMEGGQLHLSVRQAMLFYYLRNFGFDPRKVKDEVMRNESSYMLTIENIEEIEKCIGRRG
ncbi:WYL domain-containing protein [Kordiimonas aestuarii]|uniref:WYL domain-containing protein n=1 Tax=Kordiimonas aestuarii TaxID=1005925 RepID=UPI0021D36184|nr:WYL domain-containing protein [Kordiimonas aestuarii]